MIGIIIWGVVPLVFPHPVRLSAPVVRVTQTTKITINDGLCNARTLQLKSGPIFTLSVCNNPWVTTVKIGDRLQEQRGGYIGFTK